MNRLQQNSVALSAVEAPDPIISQVSTLTFMLRLGAKKPRARFLHH